jgi:hypothetical protein
MLLQGLLNDQRPRLVPCLSRVAETIGGECVHQPMLKTRLCIGGKRNGHGDKKFGFSGEDVEKLWDLEEVFDTLVLEILEVLQK